MESARLCRIASRVAGSPETEGNPVAPVTGISKPVQLDTGSAQVTITKAGGIHERYWRDVEFDILLPGEKAPIHVVCEAGDRLRDVTKFASPAEEQKVEAVLLNGWRPFDLAAQAIEQIAEDYYSSAGQEVPEFFDIENGFILEH